MTVDLLALKGLVRSTYGRVCWTHKIQEKQAEIDITIYNIMEIIDITCSAIVGVGIISLFFTENFWIKLFSAIISFCSFFVGLFFKSYDLKGKATLHKKTAIKLLSVREKLKVLIIEIKTEKKDFEVLSKEYQEINELLDTIYEEAPNTGNMAVNKARRALSISKDNEITDDEIDRDLPEELRG